MLIHDMFAKDIDRNINGVVDASQQSDSAIRQELEEYVITKELAGHFATFFDAYEQALYTPTREIGVWISGFYGSGKSHLLKMLSYLLSNPDVDGKPAIDYFESKFAEPMLAARAHRCAGVPTESILFNVDSGARGSQKADALRQVFAKAFNDHVGFFGDQPTFANLERLIDEEGLTVNFRETSERVIGMPWLKARKKLLVKTNKLIDILAEIGMMERDEAERWINQAMKDPESKSISVDELTDQIRDYAERRAQECGGDFRLLFMADEMGQFIGDNSSLMLNLQTIVEELGTKCAGRVWVMVTSQEAIDDITNVVGQDFSKIKGRFDTRLSLSSSSADEVIKRRILEKNDAAKDVLRAHYAETSSMLKNILTFEDSTASLTGYASADDFVQAFPFASYQFRLMQGTFEQIRKHGTSNQSGSKGERSMLSSFQGVTKKIEDKDENTLVPFWMFYDTVARDLDSDIHLVIEKATEDAKSGQGLEPQDVNVLKLLFLIRWDKGLKPCLGNIVTLMTDKVGEDRMALRESVQASLDRLVHENYVSRNGDTYQFLTDDEQEIARQISRQDPEPDRMRAKVASLFFDQVFASGKLVMGENTFDIEKCVDETRVRQTDGLTLRIMTMLADEADLERTALIMRSERTPEAIIVLNEETNYYDPLREALQIEMFTNSPSGANLPQSQQDIIRSKNQQKVELEKRAAKLIEEAVCKGTFYAAGEEIRPATSQSAKRIVEDVASRLVEIVYPKLSLIEKNYQTDADIKGILNGATRTLDASMSVNTDAVNAVEVYLGNQGRLPHKPSMAEVQGAFQKAPFGWRQKDIAACMAELLLQNRAKATYAGNTLELTNPRLVDCLAKPKSKDAAACTIELRTHVPEDVRKCAADAVREFCHENDVPTAEEALAKRAHELLQQREDELQDMLDKNYAHGTYPGKGLVTKAHKLATELLAAGMDPSDLLPAIQKAHKDLLDAAEDLEPVETFWKGQVELFDRARRLAERLSGEAGYLEANQEATNALKQIREIVGMDAPYRRIKDLGGCCQTLETAHGDLLKAKKNDLLNAVNDYYSNIEDYASEKEVANPSEAATRKLERQNAVHKSDSLSNLDALRTQLENDQVYFYSQIDKAADRKRQAARKDKPGTVTPAPTRPAQPQDVAPAKPRVKTLPRYKVCPPKQLRSAEEIDAYCASLRQHLLDALEGADAVQIN